MRIGIELNGIVRNLFPKIEEVYQKTFLMDEIKEKKFNLIGEEELIDLQDDFLYKIKSPITTFDISNHLSFRNNEELFEFLYEENPIKIFGMSELLTSNSAIELNTIYKMLRSENDILIISNEIGLSKPATLTFLGRNGILLEEIIFYSEKTMERMWNSLDVLVTSNSELFKNKPEDKIVIAFNKNIVEWGDKQITSLLEVPLIIKELNNV